MIRVVELIATFDTGGAERQLAETAARLDRRRFAPHAIALTRGGPTEALLERGGVPFEVIGKLGKADPRSLVRLARRLKELAPDVIHTHLFTANAYGRAAARLSGCRAALVASEESTDPKKPAWARAIDRRLAPATARVLCVSEAVAKVQRRRGIPAEKIRVIYPGVDVEALERVAATGGAPAARPPDPARIVTVCRLDPPKNVGVLLEAVSRLRKAGRGATLDIVGDGSLRARLEAHAARLGLLAGDPPAVRFLGRRDDAAAVAAASIAVLSSDYEGLGVAILEAMALEKPVVASDVGGAPEAVGDCGLLVPPGDPEALATALRALIDDPARARALGERGRERVLERFTMARRVAEMEGVFEEVASLRSR